VEQIVEDGAAEINYQLKHQARRVEALLHTLASMAGVGHTDDSQAS
jgi:hypothetical protein